MSVGTRGSRIKRVAQMGAIGLGALLGIVGVFRGLTADMAPGDGDPDAEFRTHGVERGDLAEPIVAAGSIEPLVRVPVIAEVSGIISLVHVEEGDRVHKGQPLFELDRERLDARVAERRADLQLRKANASYDLVGRAEVLRDRAKREHARKQELHGSQVASQLALQRAEQDLRLAEIGVRDARAELQARHAAVAQSRELLRQAERDLANAVIRAPIDGIVIRRDGEIGRAVADVTNSGGTVVAVVADDTRLRLVAEVDENDIARVRVGLESTVSIDAFPDEEFEGHVRKISAAGTVEGSVSNFEVEIEVASDGRLRVGMSCDARVVVQRHEDVVIVPNTAIVRRDGAIQVRIPDVGGGGEAFVLAPIRLGSSDGFNSIVAEGLSEGDVILLRADGVRG